MLDVPAIWMAVYMPAATTRSAKRYKCSLPGRWELPIEQVQGRFWLLKARRLGLAIIDLAERWGQDASSVAPCLAVAYLLAEQLEAEWRQDRTPFSK
jgi:hypothetical protein